MRRIARRETRAGYRSVARHLRREGWQANIKRIHRLWKQEGLKLPLQSGDRGAVIDFRHVIKWLVRKPGAFSQYRWREAMFPSLVWRGLYDHLCSRHAGHVADVRYLEILELAANEGLSAVENMVEELLSAPKGVVSAAEVVALLRSYEDEALAFRERQAMPVSLEVYDDLLEGAL
jgi:hypothetical protein